MLEKLEKFQVVISALIISLAFMIATGFAASRLVRTDGIAVTGSAYKVVKSDSGSLWFYVNCTGKSSMIDESQIIGYNTQVSKDMIRAMQKKVPEISEFKFVHSPVRSYCNNSDIVITIKNN